MSMASNIPAKHFDQIRVAVGTTIEVALQLPDVRTLRHLKIQCLAAEDIYVTRTAGGTLSTDNYWTIKSGDVLELLDIELQPLDAQGTIYYARTSTTTTTVELLYAQ